MTVILLIRSQIFLETTDEELLYLSQQLHSYMGKQYWHFGCMASSKIQTIVITGLATRSGWRNGLAR